MLGNRKTVLYYKGGKEMSKYRDMIMNEELILEEKDNEIIQSLSGKERIVSSETVIEILDEIENTVNRCFNKIEEIKGLSEIDEITNMLKKISDDLY